ncbi:MAG: CPBP family intramembrane glutamic endopeptidase [Desulfovibrionales bacterium]
MQHHEPTRSVPWTARDAWIGTVSLFLWMMLSLGAVLFFGQTAPGIDPGILITLLELPLLAVVWWFTVRKYHTGWEALGFSGFDPKVLWSGVKLLFLAMLFNMLYGLLLSPFGLRAQPDLVPIFQTLDSPWPLLLGGAVLIPVVEEVFFRGFLFTGLRERYGWQRAMVISALLFALVHLQFLAIPPIFVMGLIFAYLYQRSGSIWPATILHVAMNAMALGGAYLAFKQTLS